MVLLHLLLLLHLLHLLINQLLVLAWHFVLYVRHVTRFIEWIICHFSQNVQERRDREFLTLSCSFDAQNTWLPIHVSIRLYQEIITFVDEALADFTHLLLRWVSVFEHLYIFATCYLLFPLNTLVILDEAYFV